MTINLKIRLNKRAVYVRMPGGRYRMLLFGAIDEERAVALLPEYGCRREWLVGTEWVATVHECQFNGEQLLGCVCHLFCKELEQTDYNEGWKKARYLTLGRVEEWLRVTLPRLLPQGGEPCQVPKQLTEMCYHLFAEMLWNK